MRISVRFGKDECFEAEVASDRVVGVCLGPRAEPLSDPGEELSGQLEHPLDFPPLRQAVVPGDRVAIALDDALPQADVLVEPIVERLLQARVGPGEITLLSPGAGAGGSNGETNDPRAALPPPLRERVRWEVAGSDAGALRYLANTASGQRVYLHRSVVDADVVLPVGCLRPDPLMGCRSPGSVVYPALSDDRSRQRLNKLALAAAEARAAAQDDGHGEPRGSSCEEIEEVAWLLGIQFAVAVVPGEGEQIAHVLAGDARSVAELGRRHLANTWTFSLPRRSDLVVAGMAGCNGEHGPERMAAALESAQRVVKRGGRIVLLSHVTGRPGAALQAMAAATEPSEALRRFSDEPPHDALAAQRIARAVSWARVYLLSGLDEQLVEALSMVPLDSVSEAGRLVSRAESVVVLNEAHHVVTALDAEERP